MTRYAGLAIENDSLRLAIFEGSPKKYALVDYIEESITADSEIERRETIRGILSEIFENKENRGMDVVTSLDSRQMVLREISVPFTRDDQIAKTVRFEAETYLHAFSIDDVIIEYLKCSETEDSSRLLICAADKEKIGDHLDVLRESKIDPPVVEIDATALATAFSNTPLGSDDQNVLLVQVDQNATRLVFLQHGKVVKIRSIWSHSSAESGSTNGAQASSDRTDTSAATAARTRMGADTPSSTSPPTGNGAGGNGSADGKVRDDIAKRFEAIERSLEDLDQDDEPADEVPFVVLSDEDYETLRGDEDDESSEVDIDELIDARSEPQDEAAPVADSGGGGGAIPEGDDVDEPVEVGTATLVATEEGSEEETNPIAHTLARFGSSEPLARLILEIERTFAAYLIGNSIDLVVVTGDSADRLDVVQRLRDHFEVDVTSFDLGDSFPVEWDGEVEVLNRRGAVACGLGLRALGKGATTFDLRKDEYRFERHFARLMPSLTLLGLLLCALSLLWAAREHNQLRSLEVENARLRQVQEQVTTTFFGEPVSKAPNPNYLAATSKKLNEIQGKGRSGGSRSSRVKEYLSAMAIIKDITNAIGDVKPIVYPRYTSLELKGERTNSSKTTIKFEVDSIEDYDRIIRGFKNCTIVEVFDKGTKPIRDGGYEITVEFKLRKDQLPKNSRS